MVERYKQKKDLYKNATVVKRCMKSGKIKIIYKEITNTDIDSSPIEKKDKNNKKHQWQKDLYKEEI